MSRTKLLLADDSITIQKVVNLTFADQGMDVVVFSDGDSAIENIDDVKPDIVLADVHMPGINGYQVCELIRSNESTKNTPVILLVGSFEPFDQDEADRVGANAHLTKPFSSIAEVIATVEGLLAASQAPTEAAAPPQPEGPRPDTSDIDSLYHQSFVETMELPDHETLEFDVEGYDDEMIQTSYAEPDLAPPVEGSLYSDDAESDASAPVVEIEETESLIAESLPAEAAPEQLDPEPVAEQDKAVQDAPAESWSEVEEPQTPLEEPPTPSDPFATVAGEPPPVASHEETRQPSEVRFSFDDSDLLDLPGPPPRGHVEYTAPNAAAANGTEVVSLSPELIDLIVQKVVDRLEERGRGDEARSVTGS